MPLHAKTLSPNAVAKPIKKLQPATSFFFAWLFLNILMNIDYPAPLKHLLLLLRISPEILFLIGFLTAGIWLGMPFHRGIYWPLTLLVIFLRFFRLADELVPMYFFRPFNLYIDSQFLPDLVDLLYHTLPLKALITYVVVSLVLTAGMVVGIWWSFKSIHRYLCGLKKGRILLGAVIAGFAMQLMFSNGEQAGRSAVFHRGFFHRIIEEVDFVLHVKGVRTQNLQVIRQTARALENISPSLDKLAGTDVYLIFIESYGRTIFKNKRHFASIQPLLKQSERELSEQGFGIYSGFLESPTFGGSSWLAHGTVASGVELSNQLIYDLLVTSRAPTIAHFFNKAGYRTVSVMPGTRWPWPEGKFFGYQKHYFARDFKYHGPSFGWAPMADQYVLQYIYRKEINRRTQPLFIEFVLISSHAPFHRQPPYLENWSQIGDGRIYYQQKTVTFPVIWPDLSNAAEAYHTSIAYEIKVLKSFIEHYIKDDTLIIIMGDHQPNVQITGPHSSWSVPVHVISRNKDFLDPFESNGFTPGFIPKQSPPYPGMETFLFNFLKGFN